MKVVKIKKITNQEIQAKLLVLKASGQFDDNSLKLLEIVAKNGEISEFNDKQVEFLKSISLIEEEIGNMKQSVQNNNKENYVLKSEYIEDRKPNIQGKEDTIERKDNTILSSNDNHLKNVPYVELNNDRQGIDTTMTVNMSDEIEDTKQKKEQEQEKKFVPDSPEQITNMSQEEIGRMFYLTPERIIESIKMINGGTVWQNLAQTGQNTTIIQSAIMDAYRSCTYLGDLTNPNFLDGRISRYLPEDVEAVDFKGLHMAALMGTYVGYHVEKNEEQINDVNVDGTKKANVAIATFPTIIDEMPQSLKEQKQSVLVKSIKHRIEDIVNEADSYRALALLVPFEETIDEALVDYSEGLHDTKENKSTKAYINIVRKDIAGEMDNKLNDLNITMELDGIDWENPNTRKTVIDMIETLQGQGRENEIKKLVEEINMSFTVKSPSDLDAVDSACADLAKLSDEGVEVNIAFKLPTEQILNEDLQQGLDEIVDKYENISRDKSEEAEDKSVDEIIEAGVEASLDKEKNSDKQLGGVMVQGIINNLSMSATSLEEIQQEREEDEIGYFNIPIGGGGF